MLGRALISIAMIGFLAVVYAAAHSQTVTDPSGNSSAATSSYPITPPPTLPDVPPLLPGRSAPGLPHYPAPTTSPGQFAPAPNPGPVTGYGPGGMAPVPGAPANPPYSYGPLR
jgi:hypothetical protein